jgi:DNA repair exonuclease SbcCD ATPase subunit
MAAQEKSEKDAQAIVGGNDVSSAVKIGTDGKLIVDEQDSQEKAAADRAQQDAEAAEQAAEQAVNKKADAARQAADEADRAADEAEFAAKEATAEVDAAESEIEAAEERLQEEIENLAATKAEAAKAEADAAAAAAKAASDGTDASRENAELMQSGVDSAKEAVADAAAAKAAAEAALQKAKAAAESASSKLNDLFSKAAAAKIEATVKATERDAEVSTAKQLAMKIKTVDGPSSLGHTHYALGASTNGMSQDFYANTATVSALVAVVALVGYVFGRRSTKRAHAKQAPMYGALSNSQATGGDMC